MYAVQRAVMVPADEIVVQRASGWQILRNIAPLTSGSQNVHQPVHDLSDIDRPLVATAFGGRNPRFNDDPFVVGQVMRISQAVTVVTETGFHGPHEAPRESVPRIESQTIRAGQAPALTDSFDSTCSRTDT